MNQRSLKFRAWDTTAKKWIESDYLAISLDGSLSGLMAGKHLPEELVIQQFTGLKDKNGVEIYEGDILKLRNGRVSRHEVKFEGGCFVVSMVPTRNKRVEHREVIGNIYENPDLMEAA